MEERVSLVGFSRTSLPSLDSISAILIDNKSTISVTSWFFRLFISQLRLLHRACALNYHSTRAEMHQVTAAASRNTNDSRISRETRKGGEGILSVASYQWFLSANMMCLLKIVGRMLVIYLLSSHLRLKYLWTRICKTKYSPLPHFTLLSISDCLHSGFLAVIPIRSIWRVYS
jgi:hypothetical protein